MLRWLAPLACLLVCSCFELREEVWLKPNGSGRAEFEYHFPTRVLIPFGGETGLERQIREVFDAEEAISLDRLELESSADGETRFLIALSTESMFDLLELRDSERLRELAEASSDFAGSFDVQLRGLDLEVERRIELDRALGLASLAISRADRDRRRLRYIIHLPAPARSSNADRVADGGRTLAWERTLGEALRDPVDTRFSVRIPLPWWAVVSILAIILLLAWALVALIRRLVRRRASAA